MQHVPQSDPPTQQHHDVLSVSQPAQQRQLLDYLSMGLPNPLEILLQETLTSTPLPQEANPVVENPTAEPQGPATPARIQVGPAPARPKPTPERIQVGPAPARPKPVEPIPQFMTLGQPCPLSQCQLWQIQENFYKSEGIEAWAHNVPNFITSSVYIAEAYAEMIWAFIEDSLPHLDLSEPIYIVELATGTGRFSFSLLKELERKQACFARLKAVQWRYIMTDFTDSNPQFWQSHEKLQPFIEKGLLDFAVFNPITSQAFELRVHPQLISGEHVKNPLIAISNYFFDSIPQDNFRVENKRLSEGLVTLERNITYAEPESQPDITEIEAYFHYRELPHANYYPHAAFNQVLNTYRHQIKQGTFLFPIGAFNVIRNLQQLANHQLVLISSDKAYTDIMEMIKYEQHGFAIHGGAFSYMVNYDAIGRYFTQANGHFLHTTDKHLSIQTVMCIEKAPPDCPWERLHYVFHEKIDRFNLINSTCSLLPPNIEPSPAMRLNQMMATIRLNLNDPYIFYLLEQKLVDLVPFGIHSHHDDLADMMENAWEYYYQSPGEANVPFWFSQMYYLMERYEKSIEYLDQAIRLFGEHEALHFMRGQNYEKLSQWHQARQAYEQSLAIDPQFEEALIALTQLKQRFAH